MQARLQQGQNGQQQGLPNGTPQQRLPSANGVQPNGTPSNGQNLTVPGQNRARGPMPAQMAGQVQMQNGLRPQPLMNGVPQAQMQGMQANSRCRTLPSMSVSSLKLIGSPNNSGKLFNYANKAKCQLTVKYITPLLET
jgi:hypothetical protein